MKTKEHYKEYNKIYRQRPERRIKRNEEAKEYRSRPEVKERNINYSAIYYKVNKEELKEKRREYHYKKKYGLTLEQYEKMYNDQEGNCLGCGIHKEFTGKKHEILHVDHVHDSKPVIVRGLLCGSCNRALGLLKDNTETLKKLINNLDKYNGI